MQGTTWNGSASVTKGTGRYDTSAMVAIGGLVAFATSRGCSPDGRQSWGGCKPTQEGYLLQEEILLEEYSRPRKLNSSLSVDDTKEIFEIPEIHWINGWNSYNSWDYLLFISDSLESEFQFFESEITEVRNHPGKFLHIYKVARDFISCEKSSLEDTKKAILEKVQDEKNLEIALKQSIPLGSAKWVSA